MGNYVPFSIFVFFLFLFCCFVSLPKSSIFCWLSRCLRQASAKLTIEEKLCWWSTCCAVWCAPVLSEKFVNFLFHILFFDVGNVSHLFDHFHEVFCESVCFWIVGTNHFLLDTCELQVFVVFMLVFSIEWWASIRPALGTRVLKILCLCVVLLPWHWCYV